MPLILPKAAYYELEEKRSKFIGFCAPVEDEAGAKAEIARIRKAHPKANHHVFAFSIGENFTRISDDGEPTGTAAMPILNIFQRGGIINYVCVVTRYFGGTLLGTGGLVRAYSKAAKGALDAAEPETLIIKTQYLVTCAYNRYDQVKYLFENLYCKGEMSNSPLIYNDSHSSVAA